MKTVKRELIDKAFSDASNEGRTALVAYITAGDPDYDTSLAIVDNLVEAGIDVLELGVPFSDPLADGEANQLAAVRALDSGMTPGKVLELSADIHKKYPTLPIVLFTYLNPVAYSGDFDVFCSNAVASGVSAILPLDLPPEEASEYMDSINNAQLPVVSLIAPTSTPERVKLLAEHASGFIYYVCREGVTGEQKEFASGVKERIDIIKANSKLPVVVGFGISTPEHVRDAAATGVDGVVVGSAIVRKVEAMSKGEGNLQDIKLFVKSLRDAL